jgi:hypothetical protein
MKPNSQLPRLMASLAAGALLAALPIKVHLSASGPSLWAAYASAKDGSDDSGGSDDHGGGGGDDHGGNSGGSGGGGGDDNGSDDHGGNSGRGGSDDHGGNSGSGGSDDHGGNGGSGSSDDHGRNSGSGGSDDHGGFDDKGGDRGGNGGGKVEITPAGIEVVHSDGTKEEIENGRYERKDASGHTVEERPATTADFTRLSATGSPPASRPTIRVGHVTKIEAEGGNLEVLYSTGWKEELQSGRYELKDPNNNTVVERPARQSDIDRLQEIAGR